MIIRPSIIASLLLSWAFSPPISAQTVPWPTQGWVSSTPEAEGVDPAGLIELENRITAGDFGHIDRVLVIRNGRVIVNKRYDNDYATISKGIEGPLGCGIDACQSADEVHQYNYLHPDHHPYYQGRDVHSLQSVTKSVTATLIGIGLRSGEISGLHAPLLSFFEDYDLSSVDPRLHEATLEDLLTMRSGIEWHETDRPFDETNTTLQLEGSQDWIQFTLDQPMDAAPGEKWVYSSGGSHLMSGIIKHTTGLYATEYAEQRLFGPLGITDYHWKLTPKGYPDTEGGLYLEAEQLAKIGYLYLQNGVWEDQRILPENWAEMATRKHVEQVNNLGWGYGFQWWRLDRGDIHVWAGLGFGGQFLIVLPQYQVIGVINSWNVFGGQQAGILMPFVDALIGSVTE